MEEKKGEERLDEKSAEKPTEPTDKPAEASPIKSVESEKFKTDYLYLQAEFDNYRKQVIKERSQLVKYGSERVLVEILGVLDNLQRALSAGPSTNLESLQKGMELISVQLKAVVEQFGITEVPSEGVKFDPTTHEALSSEETDQVTPGHVLRVFRRAYKLHDKLVRPAQVVVAKEKAVK